MAWRRSDGKSLSETMMIILRKNICITRPQWIKLVSYKSNMLFPTDVASFKNNIMVVSRNQGKEPSIEVLFYSAYIAVIRSKSICPFFHSDGYGAGISPIFFFCEVYDTFLSSVVCSALWNRLFITYLHLNRLKVSCIILCGWYCFWMEDVVSYLIYWGNPINI